MRVASDQGDCNEVQEVRRELMVWVGGHKGPVEARGYPRWFWGLKAFWGYVAEGYMLKRFLGV